MIKLITEIKCEGAGILARLEARKRMEELTVDRPESTFGVTPSLTRKEIARGNKLVEDSRQITAW